MNIIDTSFPLKNYNASESFAPPSPATSASEWGQFVAIDIETGHTELSTDVHKNRTFPRSSTAYDQHDYSSLLEMGMGMGINTKPQESDYYPTNPAPILSNPFNSNELFLIYNSKMPLVSKVALCVGKCISYFME